MVPPIPDEAWPLCSGVEYDVASIGRDVAHAALRHASCFAAMPHGEPWFRLRNNPPTTGIRTIGNDLLACGPISKRAVDGASVDVGGVGRHHDGSRLGGAAKSRRVARASG